MELRVARGVPAFVGEQALHRSDLGVAEAVVLEVGEAPVSLGVRRVEAERRLVGRFAVGTAPQRLEDMADRGVQADLARLEPRGLLICRERFFLSHEPRRRRSGRNPALRILGLDRPQVARRCLGLGQPPERQQRRSKSAPSERQVRGLSDRMAQQALGVCRHVRGERQRGEPAQRRRVRGIFLQHLPKQGLRGLAVVGDQRRGGRLDAGPLGLTLPGALEGNARVGVLLEVDEHVAVCKPRARMMRMQPEHLPHVLT